MCKIMRTAGFVAALTILFGVYATAQDGGKCSHAFGKSQSGWPHAKSYGDKTFTPGIITRPFFIGEQK